MRNQAPAKQSNDIQANYLKTGLNIFIYRPCTQCFYGVSDPAGGGDITHLPKIFSYEVKNDYHKTCVDIKITILAISAQDYT